MGFLFTIPQHIERLHEGDYLCGAPPWRLRRISVVMADNRCLATGSLIWLCYIKYKPHGGPIHYGKRTIRLLLSELVSSCS